MAARSRVVVDERFRKLGNDLERAVTRSLNEAALIGVHAAQATPTGKYKIAGILSQIRVEPAVRTAKGWQAEIVAPNFRAIFFTKGTYARRSGKLKRPRKSTSAQKGVRPVRFMQRGRTAAAKALLPLLQRNVGEWKP